MAETACVLTACVAVFSTDASTSRSAMLSFVFRGMGCDIHFFTSSTTNTKNISRFSF